MRALDPDAYDHIWDGGYDIKSDAKVLAGKYVVEDFEVPYHTEVRPQSADVVTPVCQGPYHGADHGFAMDPRTLVRLWIGPHPKWGKRCLYVEHESYHVKLGIDRTAQQWAQDVPGFARYVVRCESAEPGTNDYLRRHGVPRLEGVKKWQGSVEDGIAHLRSYNKIIVHPRCVHTAEECRLYSYKVDKHTGDILPDIEDRHNHTIDASRYALAPLIKPQRRLIFG
jgi:phage terminase large subunit